MTATNDNATRMDWGDIVKTYPDLWVGMIDIDWKDEANIRSAVVVYTDNRGDDLFRLQLDKKIEFSRYTTPDNLGQLGLVGVFE